MGIVQFVFGALAAYFLVVVLYYVAAAVFRMIQFKKAGIQEGWKAWIPFYCNYLEFDLYYKKEYFWVWLGLALLAAVFQNSGALSTIFGLLQIAMLVLLAYYKAKAFGKSDAFTVGLVLLNIVFEGILTLGDAAYIGNQSHGIAFLDNAIGKVKELLSGKKEE